ncbi:MAG: flagellar hook-basal body complex protein [Thiotrichales bacterium]|nr:MAG: flagellar hook-basal body complex protein [Thiotrichales bacterium]
MATNFSLTALTGINSASTGLGVISNNISNAQTIGFKSSRAEFADLFYGAQNNPGTGARTQAVTQNFSQGAVNDTGNQLDLAISGNGLFILEDISGRYEAVYTRNGSFKLDKEGFITDQMGNKLQGFNKDGVLSTPDTNIYQTVLGSLNIGELNKVPKETSQVNFDMNLNGQDPVTYTTTSTGVKQSASGVLFDINTLKNQQYDGAPNYSTSKVIYDSLGGQHRMTVNYYKVEVNPPGNYPAAAPANSVDYSNETTDWYAQYIMEDFDPVTNTYFKSGSGQDAATNGTNNTTAYTRLQAKLPFTTAEAFVTGLVRSDGTAVAAGDTEVLSVAGMTLQETLDYTRSQGLVFDNAGTPTEPDSTRLALLFGNPTTALEASNAARNAALAMGLTQQQASQSASAAQTAFTANDDASRLASFNAAFGAAGVTPSIPDSVVQAYRFDSQGKLLDFNPDGNFSQISGNLTPPAKIAAPQSWYFDQPNTAGIVGVSEALTFESDLTNFTQYAGAYNIRGVTQDGYAAGDLVNVQVNKDGTIEAQYSNGRSDTVAKLALANFSDQQGMQKLGNQMWAETAASGPRQLGNPQASGFGTIQAGALEYSNVDVTGELVNMIFMQKMYQASAQVISTDKTLTQTILQL